MISLPPPPAPARSPWQRFYAAALARRARRLAQRAERLPRPVISIGNLHWGGAGKTPSVIALAEHLRDRGRRVAVLSRGYGRRSRGVVVVSRGGGPLVDLATAGDEPYLLAERLAGVAVVVGERRAEAGRRALEELSALPDLFLLDDGFSHVALARDLDLLLFPAADPWAGGRLAPSGRLREPLAAAARADAVVLTGAPPTPGLGAALAAALRPGGFAGAGFASATETGVPRFVDGRLVAPGSRIFAVAAIARPEAFFAALERLGLAVAGRLALADHAPYDARALAALERAAAAAGATAIVATEKDRAKLVGRLALPLATLPISARPEPAFWSFLDRRLAELEK